MSSHCGVSGMVRASGPVVSKDILQTDVSCRANYQQRLVLQRWHESSCIKVQPFKTQKGFGTAQSRTLYDDSALIVGATGHRTGALESVYVTCHMWNCVAGNADILKLGAGQAVERVTGPACTVP